MQKDSKILVTGSTGMVGSAVLKQLDTYSNILKPTHFELDLRNQTMVDKYFADHKPEYVLHLAAIVGGIHANNTYPAKFIFDNTQMHCNVIQSSYKHGVKKLLFPGSACTYPKFAPQPIHEKSFLDGLIEPTNIAYAAAKINGIVMCQAYQREYKFNAIVPMPTNSYGIGDNFNPDASHVIPALMKRFHDAKCQQLPEVILWGSGTPLREFIYVDDLADALLFLMKNYDSSEIINVGTMQEISMVNLAKQIAEVIDYAGNIILDTNKADGAPRKCLDSKNLFALGWQPKTSLRLGLENMYHHHFIKNKSLLAANA